MTEEGMNWWKTKERIDEEAYEQVKERKKGRKTPMNKQQCEIHIEERLLWLKKEWTYESKREKNERKKILIIQMKHRNDERKNLNWQGPERMKYRKERSNERKKIIKTQKLAIKKEKQTFFYAYNV